MQKDKLYFPNLNGLRFIAAALVLLFHSEFIMPRINDSRLKTFLVWNGVNSVEFFFVLSGFIITYLLLVEYKNSNTIDVKKFYSKRILRIWPLYYGILIFLTLLFPALLFKFDTNPQAKLDTKSITFFYLLLPNIAIFCSTSTGLLLHFWSIGIEEQFYLIWPVLMKFFRKRILPLILSIIILKVGFYYVTISYLHLENKLWVKIITGLAIEKMAIGGLGAFLLFEGYLKKIEKIIFSNFFQALCIGIIIYYMSYSAEVAFNFEKIVYSYIFNTPVWKQIVVPCLFLYLILNVSLNKNNVIKLDNKIFNYLGDISFGFYMFHLIGMNLAKSTVRQLEYLSPLQYRFLFYIVAFAYTILLASISYKYFEGYFAKFRPKAI